MSKMYKLLFSMVFMSIALLATAQKEVSGKVTDSAGAPISGATIRVVGSKAGTSTNADGAFKFTVSDAARKLSISSKGFMAKEVSVGKNLSIVLDRDHFDYTSAGDDIVVTASGLKAKKAEVGYATTNLRGDKLVQASPTNVTSALAGKVPGLQISGVSSGVNPNYSIVLRGFRSITGNNQALVVLDNVVVPNSMLGNLNPNDIESLDVLNGASAAALYGSLASNGAIIVVTKKGQKGKVTVDISQTVAATSVAYLPKLQTTFGAGSSAYVQEYTPYENQQYGPAFDGDIREVGEFPLPGGAIQHLPYAVNDKEGRLNFWETGLSSQTDFSISTFSETGTTYLAGQYLSSLGTIPGDKYNRATITLSGSQKVGRKINFDYSARYVQNNYDQATNPFGIYESVLQTPANIPLTRYKNWQTDSFAMPDYYYNAFYSNPYFVKDHYRSLARNEYLVASLAVKYAPFSWLDLTGKVGMTSRNTASKSYSDIYKYSAYAVEHAHGDYKKSNLPGGVKDETSAANKIMADFIATLKKNNVGKWDFRANLGIQLLQDRSRAMDVTNSSLAAPGLFNVGNRLNPVSGTEAISLSRTAAVWGEFYATYNKLLTLHLTGRRDAVSVLDPGYNTFFYPGANLSFVASEAFEFLRNSKTIDMLKFRVAMSKVGSVNINPYSTLPTISQAEGYPYNNSPAFSIGNRLVQKGLKPEYTLGKEIGVDMQLFRRKVNFSVTYYNNQTENQTMGVSISGASGYSSLLSNTGLTQGQGIESSIDVILLENRNWGVRVGANYTYNDNKVLTLGIKDLTIFRLFSYGDGTGVYASEGLPFPALYGTTYVKDSATGKVVVDRVTGFPSLNPNISFLGNTQPKHRLGLTLDVAYKSFSFNAVAEYRGGYVIHNGSGRTFDFTGAGINTVMFNRHRFVFPNSVYWDDVAQKYVDNTNITVAEGGPDFWAQGMTRMDIAENYVTSGAFWKLREVSLTYKLSPKLVKSTGFLQGAKLSLVGRNLFILTPETNVYTDPEFSANGAGNYVGLNTLGQNPPSRYYGATLTLNF